MDHIHTTGKGGGEPNELRHLHLDWEEVEPNELHHLHYKEEMEGTNKPHNFQQGREGKPNELHHLHTMVQRGPNDSTPQGEGGPSQTHNPHITRGEADSMNPATPTPQSGGAWKPNAQPSHQRGTHKLTHPPANYATLPNPATHSKTQTSTPPNHQHKRRPMLTLMYYMSWSLGVLVLCS